MLTPVTPMEPGVFERAYTELITRIWTSEEFATLALSDPHAALAQVGISAPPEVSVTIALTEQATVISAEEAYASWVAGFECKKWELTVPDVGAAVPTASANQLTPEIADTTYCCCPCCTCSA